MKSEITVEEYSALEAPLVLDIRNADSYERGTIPGALHAPVEMEDEYDEPEAETLLALPVYLEDGAAEKLLGEGAPCDQNALTIRSVLALAGGENRPVCLLCHTGANSLGAARALRAAGYEACSIAGGYRAYLNWKLRREFAADAAEDRRSENGGPAGEESGSDGTKRKKVPTRLQNIERSLIKKFRKQLWCRLTKAVREYELIQDGDKIAVCISGGKDSMLMAKLMQEIQRHGTKRFEIVYLCMNPGYNEENWELVQNNAKLLGIPLTVFGSDIFDAVENVEHHPCYLCARMRRGYLYNHAKQLGCNKIALGHHYDDVIETILMGILYAGKTETMMPKLHSQNFAGMELIRPLYLIREADIKAWCKYNDLHFIQCACRFTETCSMEGGNTSSKRAFVKRLIRELSQDEGANVEQNIFNCVRDINLRTVIGYHRDGQSYHFLDDYDTYKNTD